MRVCYHVFKDLKLDPTGRSDEEIAEAARGPHRGERGPRRGERGRAREIARLRYSFVSMRYHAASGTLFLGATNTGGDLLVAFDPARSRFRSCGYARGLARDPHEAKIHKGLQLVEAEGALYFGTATLSGMARTMDARGGSLVRYDIRQRKFRRLARPTPGDYHQSTAYDLGRGKAYIWTRRGCFAVWDLRARRLVRYEAMGSTPHNGCVDDAGGVWGSYGPGRHAFYRYDPDRDRFEFPGLAFPNAREAADIMYDGAGPVDGFLNGGDGFLYAASALGELYRLDPRAPALDFLGKPVPGKRLPAMALGPDGWLYMAGGDDRRQMLARYSREQERFELLGPVAAPDGTRCFRSHELAVVDGTVYIGETDNARRSGYLWACEL